MRNRREFVAAMGAGIAVVLSPDLAAAHWFRRRRSCPPPEVPTAPCCGPVEHVIERPALLITCSKACPKSLYAHIGTLYYYHCICYPGCSRTVDASTTQNITSL